MNAPLQFVSVKAFGDLMIAETMLARARASRPDLTLVIAGHLAPLHAALGAPVPAIVFDGGTAGVPAAFNARRAGAAAAVRSLAQLALAMRRSVPHPGKLVFDRLGVRERVLAGLRTAVALPEAPNIYLAYARMLGLPLPTSRRTGAGRKIGIFPGSRIPNKNMPLTLVESLIARLAAAGCEPRVSLLAGERPDLEASGMPQHIYPRDFAAAIDAVGACDAIVSADSLPAHIAEWLDLPAFVVSPCPNDYWLPLNAFQGRFRSVFDPFDDLALDAFLSAGR